MKALAVAAAVLAASAYAQSNLTFTWYGPAARVITPTSPNGTNTTALFCFDNPASSAVNGQIYNLVGRQVTTLGSPVSAVAGSLCSKAGEFNPQYLPWDGTNNGAVVHSGIYIYRIQAEGKNYTGTIVVVR
jgi:Tfp pilus assembly protein PilX